MRIYARALTPDEILLQNMGMERDWWTVDRGGSDTLSVGQFTLAGTVGQPDAAELQAAGPYTLTGGFWSMLATAPPTPPFITSALTATGRVNRPFSYTITATDNPTGYGASGLPADLNVNTTSGRISGTPGAAGAFNVLLSATNTTGVGTTNLLLSIADKAPLQWPNNRRWNHGQFASRWGSLSEESGAGPAGVSLSLNDDF